MELKRDLILSQDESITFTTDKPTIIHHHEKPTSNYVNVTRSRHDQLRIFLSAIEPRVPNGLSSSAPSKTSSATTKFELLLVKHLGILLFLILFSVVKLSFLMSFAVFGLGLGIFGTALKVGLVIFGPIIKLSLLITSPILRLFYANLKTFYNLYISSELLGPLMQIEMDVIGPLVTLIKNNTIQWLKFEAQFFLPPLLELWQKLLKV